MLILNTALILMNPLPDALNKGVASQFMTVSAFLCEQAFDNGLSRDTRVVFPWHPEGIITEHTVITDKNIFSGCGNRMA